MLREDTPPGEAGARAAPAGDRAAERLRLARAFTGLTAATWGLIVLGALVRAHDAGLACPDWPLCFWRLVPRIDLRVGFEYTHRIVAGSVSLGFALLAWRALRRAGAPAGLGRHLLVASGLLALQILLGALTVWHLLARWTVTSHLLTGNAFAVALAFTASTLAESARPAPASGIAPPVTPGARASLSAAAALLAFQVALGGLVSSSYAGMACPEWPACNGGIWFPSWRGGVGLHLLHRMNGYALLLALAGAAWLARGGGAAGGLTRLAAVLAVAQVAVGVANVRLGIPVEVTGLHSALAALLVLSVSLALRAAWKARPVPARAGEDAQPAHA